LSDIKITLETLYDISRNEKKREDLQPLEETFFTDVVEYLKEKHSLLGQTSEHDEIFALGEKQKLEYELKSIQRLLKQIYELREKKIIDIALNRSRTGSDIIDTSAMLLEEKEFYEKHLHVLDTYRRGILLQLFKREMPSIKQQRLPQASDLPKETYEEKPNPLESFDGMTKIKFLHPVPKFIWKDMKEYGPFSSGDETEIFPEVAALLVRKGRAEKA
jgi:DNA replication initiation complex subunit (GINS family)